MPWHLFPPLLDGTLREHYLLLFGAAGAIALVAGSLSAWLGAHFAARRAVRRALREAGIEAPALSREQLAQLVHSVDVIALEVERISEAQRFATRVLVERTVSPVSAPRRDPGVITPH